jgi:hypothetical protein
MPEYGQNFVKPQSGGSGSWMAKLFGGISDDKRDRQMAQIQYDLHVAKGSFDTDKEVTLAKARSAAKAAGDDYTGERGFSRERRRAKFYKKEGVNLADMASSSASQLSMQKKATFDYGGGPSKTEVNTGPGEKVTDTPGETPGTNPSDGGTKPGKPRTPRKPRQTKKSTGASIAATMGGVKSGNIDFTQATGGEFGSEAGISPKTAADFGAHVAGGGNQDSYLNQFSASGRRKRTPNTPPPPPPSGDGGKTPKKPKVTKPGNGGTK